MNMNRNPFTTPTRAATDRTDESSGTAAPRGASASSDPREEIRRRILRAPSVPWKPDSAQSAGLAFEARITTSLAGVEDLRTTLGRLPFFDFTVSETRLSVVQGLDRLRIASTGAGVFGRDFVQLSYRDVGAVFLDTSGRTFLHVDNEQIVPVRTSLKPGDYLLQSAPLEGEHAAQLEIIFNAPLRARLRIWLDPAERLRPYALALAAFMLGCPDQNDSSAALIRAIAERGAPIRSELSLLDAGGQAGGPATRVALEEMILRPITDDEFAIPPGYVDLRDRDAVARLVPPGGITMSSQGRLRDLRPGRTSPRRRGAAERLEPEAITGQDHELPHVPQCLPSTYRAILAVEAEQQLADDVRFLGNAISRRLDHFSGDKGKILIDWLRQFGDYSTSLPQGDGLYCLLHEAGDRAAASGSPERLGGRGLLDQLAERQVRRLLAESTLLGFVQVSPTAQKNVDDVIKNPWITPEGRYDALDVDARAEVRDAYLTQKLGTWPIDYSASTSWEKLFSNLIEIQITDIAFDLIVGRTEIIDKLTLGNNKISLGIKAPSASGRATLSRRPSTLYYTLLPFLPFLGPELASLIFTVGSFLLIDIADVTISITEPTVVMDVQFQTNVDGALEPVVSLSFDAMFSATYSSHIPDGLHNLIGEILKDVAKHLDGVLRALEATSADGVNKWLRDLGVTFPPRLGPVPTTALYSFADGRAGDRLYLETMLTGSATGVPSPFTTQVERNVESVLVDYRDDFRAGVGKDAHHYGGFVISQNLLNRYLDAVWREGAFNHEVGGLLVAELVAAITAACPGCRLRPPVHVHLFSAASPRTVLTPTAPASGGYATTFFDDLRLCLTDFTDPDAPGSTLEIQLAARASTDIGFGSLNPDTGKLDLIKISDRFFDLYFDVDGAGLRIIEPDTQGLITAGGGGLSGLDGLALPSLQGILKRIVKEALAPRSASVIPRQVGGSHTVQRYRVAGQDVLIAFYPQRGQLYGQIGLNGLILQIFPDGSIPINDPSFFTCAIGKSIRKLLSP